MQFTLRSLLLMHTTLCFALAFLLKPTLDAIKLGSILFLPRTFFGDATNGIAVGLLLTIAPALYIGIYGLLRIENPPLAIMPAFACIVFIAPGTVFTFRTWEIVLVVLISLLIFSTYEIISRRNWQHLLTLAAVIDLTLVYWMFATINLRI